MKGDYYIAQGDKVAKEEVVFTRTKGRTPDPLPDSQPPENTKPKTTAKEGEVKKQPEPQPTDGVWVEERTTIEGDENFWEFAEGGTVRMRLGKGTSFEWDKATWYRSAAHVHIHIKLSTEKVLEYELELAGDVMSGKLEKVETNKGKTKRYTICKARFRRIVQRFPTRDSAQG